ncbi:hypothetical protein [Fodinibius salsisoli]|uniref:Uncharacterized protein n=1 Tax=Fodinibius salsisoli TaxID=2820877 RepID=A0ABT3PQU0_9BACT|nr:hypothetical protein [Fodinibius salsisoli]MCW9708223.1 hypothetical protein [Fodinibius salsisoli]
MKWAVVILILFLPTTLLAQEYKVKDRCMGGGVYAMVVEYNSQYYVVETPRYFQSGWIIQDLLGIAIGGSSMLYYSDAGGSNQSFQVRVLSRMQWRYAGYPGARSVCRQITQGARLR